MANVQMPYGDPGEAAFEQLDNWTQEFLLSGSDPKVQPAFPMTIAADEVFAQFAVVGYDADSKLVMATYSADPENPGIQAIGVVTQAVVGNAAGTTTVPVWYSGNFNPDALIWDESFDTDAKKLAAFVGAPTPTTILIRKRG